MRIIDGPQLDPSSRYSRWHVLLYSLPISRCTPLHSCGGGLGSLWGLKKFLPEGEIGEARIT